MPKPILIMMAMEAEAAPVAAALRLGGGVSLHPRLPGVVRRGEAASTAVVLVTHGRDQRFGVDAIGTGPAAVTAWAAAEKFAPGIIVSAGTAGGFRGQGAEIGDVYLSRGAVVFHDRRIPLAGFEAYGVGSYASIDASGIAAELGLKLGGLTTGDSLDMSGADEGMIRASGAQVKDMEAAAVAWVAGLVGARFLGVKAITDLVDVEHPTAAQFVENLEHAVTRLSGVMPGVVARLAGL